MAVLYLILTRGGKHGHVMYEHICSSFLAACLTSSRRYLQFLSKCRCGAKFPKKNVETLFNSTDVNGNLEKFFFGGTLPL